MNPLAYPKRIAIDYSSRLAIWLVRRRLRKKKVDAGVWLVLARLHEIRSENREAVRVLETALQRYPGNPVLKSHLERIRTGSRC